MCNILYAYICDMVLILFRYSDKLHIVRIVIHETSSEK